MFKPLAMGINNRLGVDAYVPILTQNFELRIYGLDGQADTEFSEVLTLSTNDIGAISEEQDVITVHYANGVMKFPNKVSFADVDWNLNCYAVLQQKRWVYQQSICAQATSFDTMEREMLRMLLNFLAFGPVLLAMVSTTRKAD